MKSKLYMCNYYGMCDESGKSVGHTAKVTKEYAELLKENYELSLCASPSVVKEIDDLAFEDVEKLKYDIEIQGNGVIKRIIDKCKLLYNLHQIFRKKGVFFFYQVDFFFFFYVSMFFKCHPKRKVYCLIYHQNFTGGKCESILQRIYNRALKKIDGVIYTQKTVGIKHNNALWMPDFLYDRAIYEKYQKKEKMMRCVCVGTMNRYRQLEELIDVFRKWKMPLLIVGRFDDTERYERLTACKSNNVIIRNENISYSEYLELLGTSCYSILPYDMNQYINRTSGVLLESVYVGCVPIAPKMLLEQNEIPGIGYDNLCNIKEEVGNKEFCVKKLEDLRDRYCQDLFVEQLKNWFR